MNGFSDHNYDKPPPKGWTSRDSRCLQNDVFKHYDTNEHMQVFVEPNTYVYYNASMQRDKEEPKYYPHNYSNHWANF